jgi:hypothetical protein
MNATPPTDDQGEDLDELYRKSLAQYPSRPSVKVRQAILEHSARLATNQSPAGVTGQSIQSGTSWSVGRIARATRSSGPKWRRPVLVGSLAAAAVAGLLVGPQFLRPGTPPISASKLTQSTGRSESAVPETGVSSPVVINLPAAAPAPDVPAPALQAAPGAAPAARANTDQAASEASNSAVSGGVSDARTEDSTEPVVTGMRVRQTPSAPRAAAAAAAMTSRAAGAADSSAPEAVPDATAPIDARDSNGRTGLMLAVLQGRLDMVVALLRGGADPNAADTTGVTPLQAARAKHQTEIADALLRAGAR